MVNVKPFFDPHLETPEDIATERGEALSSPRHSSIIMLNVKPIGVTVAEIYLTGTKTEVKQMIKHMPVLHKSTVLRQHQCAPRHLT